MTAHTKGPGGTGPSDRDRPRKEQLDREMQNTDDSSVRDADLRGQGRQMKEQQERDDQPTDDVIQLGPRTDGEPNADELIPPAQRGDRIDKSRKT